jgi:hypothetical protein
LFALPLLDRSVAKVINWLIILWAGGLAGNYLQIQ